MKLVDNPHVDLKPPENSTTALIRGSLKYYHYMCDSFNDKVGYSLMSIDLVNFYIRKEIKIIS